MKPHILTKIEGKERHIPNFPDWKKTASLILLTGKEGMPPKSSMLAKPNNTCRNNCSKMTHCPKSLGQEMQE
jgi:hypothetical protein